MTFRLAQIVFWLSAVALFYTYAGYPLLLFLVSALRPKPLQREAIEPTLTVIITAYNEERDLRAKLENTLTLDYPKQLLEVIVASDASTDGTDRIVQEFAGRGVLLHRQPQRLGKTAAQNTSVERARGEIIVFSDATTMYQPDALRAIVRNFADAKVGCVAGRLIYLDSHDSSLGRGARSYWSYETLLKKHESRASSLIGASGCLYAVRKSAYVPLPNEACSDFIVATKMVEQGLRAVFEPEAISTEVTNRRSGNELSMRVRIITQTINDLWRHRAMLNPLRSGFFGVQLFSHKVMRYLAPMFLLAMFVTSGLLANSSNAYWLIFAAQLAGYGCATAGWLFERAGLRLQVLALPQYFVLTNVASVIAVYKLARGERYARWEPIRE